MGTNTQTALAQLARIITPDGALATVRSHNTGTGLVSFERDDYSLGIAPRAAVWATGGTL